MSISLKMHGNVAVITMDDGKVNAASTSMLSDLREALESAAATSGAVVLAGREGCFSAGFDMKIMKGDDLAAREEMISAAAELMHYLYGYPRPLVMAATGHAFALGAVMLLTGDVRVGQSGDFKLGLNETAIGEILPPFGAEPAKERISSAYLIRAVVLAEIFDPQDAVKAGYLDEVALDSSAVDRAIAIAQGLVELPSEAYMGNKMSVRGDALERIRKSLDAG